jgi:hypothetical protein|tara:strand:+ start:159 stop:416 length:258 start_codon:yes stop_codon:yes gene_type:complete
MRDLKYTIAPLYKGMESGWKYFGDCETECDGHNKKMWHYLITPDNTRISIDQYFGSYYIPSMDDVENLMMELPDVRKYNEKNNNP